MLGATVFHLAILGLALTAPSAAIEVRVPKDRPLKSQDFLSPFLSVRRGYKPLGSTRDTRYPSKVTYSGRRVACELDAGSCTWDYFNNKCRRYVSNAFMSHDDYVGLWGPPRSKENDCSILAVRLSRADLYSIKRALRPCPVQDRLCKFETLSTSRSDCAKTEFQIMVDREVCTEKRGEPWGFGLRGDEVCCLRRYVKPYVRLA